MSSSLSGGTNGLNFNLVKSSSSTLTSLNSSSPSLSSALTISETNSNISQSAIRTKRTRTTRKRPNQTYNEAAELLSKAYPNLFRNLKKLPTPPCKFTKPIITECYNNDFIEPLLLPLNLTACDFDATDFSLQNKITSQTEFFGVRDKLCSEEISLNSGVVNSDELERDSGEELDCKSILEEEIEEGIDSIIGSRVEDDGNNGGDRGGLCYGGGDERLSTWFGNFGGRFGWKKAIRNVESVNLWNFDAVDVYEISPGMKKQRKKENVNSSLALPLRLKLNYEDVRKLWLERGLPFRR